MKKLIYFGVSFVVFSLYAASTVGDLTDEDEVVVSGDVYTRDDIDTMTNTIVTSAETLVSSKRGKTDLNVYAENKVWIISYLKTSTTTNYVSLSYGTLDGKTGYKYEGDGRRLMLQFPSSGNPAFYTQSLEGGWWSPWAGSTLDRTDFTDEIGQQFKATQYPNIVYYGVANGSIMPTGNLLATTNDVAVSITNKADKSDLALKQDALTPAGTNAVTSGITSGKVATYDGYATNKADVTALAGYLPLDGSGVMTGAIRSIGSDVGETNIIDGAYRTLFGASHFVFTADGDTSCLYPDGTDILTEKSAKSTFPIVTNAYTKSEADGRYLQLNDSNSVNGNFKITHNGDEVIKYDDIWNFAGYSDYAMSVKFPGDTAMLYAEEGYIKIQDNNHPTAENVASKNDIPTNIVHQSTVDGVTYTNAAQIISSAENTAGTKISDRIGLLYDVADLPNATNGTWKTALKRDVPSTYLKTATSDANSITVTKQDNTTVGLTVQYNYTMGAFSGTLASGEIRSMSPIALTVPVTLSLGSSASESADAALWVDTSPLAANVTLSLSGYTFYGDTGYATMTAGKHILVTFTRVSQTEVIVMKKEW